MSNSGEVEAQAPVKQPETGIAEEKQEKASKEKKPKAPPHPPYFQMIKEAITSLNEKGGSSPYAIAKYIDQKYQAVLPGNFRKILGLQLKNSVAKGKLIKVKASYKLWAAMKREKGKTTKAARANAGKPKEMKRQQPKSKIKKSSTPDTTKVTKTKGTRTNKPRPAKLKQLKKMKSPVVRKANKARAA